MLLLLFSGCSPTKTGLLSNGYHNLTSHYNAYFIANEKIQELEQQLYDLQKWNYDKILPVQPEFDSTIAASYTKQTENIVQKASIPIQYHPNSKWSDDSYLLVGKARYYGFEIPDAIETFKYVNTHSEDEDARHAALCELIRAYTLFEQYQNAEVVINFLTKEVLSKKNKRLFHLNAAMLYQKKEDIANMVAHLVQATELSKDDRARLNFLIGKSYQVLRSDSLAYLYYKKTLRSKPSYELEFYTKLYMAQVNYLKGTKNLLKTRKYFKKIIANPKNKEYLYRLYYELAGFELKNGYLDLALDNYVQSLRENKNDMRLKGRTYLKLGKIYYDTVKNYSLAKAYYDSAVSVMPKDEEDYEEIKNRHAILINFVKHYEIIHTNDSLLTLSELPADSLMSMAIRIIEKKIEESKEKKKKERKAAIDRANNLAGSFKKNDLIKTTTASSAWYFDNPSSISRGRNEFIKKWGDRVLEDNWRRASKSNNNLESVNNPQANVSKQEADIIADEDQEIDVAEAAKELIKSVPRTEEEKMTLLSQIEEAMYALGEIYYLQLQELNNAIETYENLLSRFPETTYEPKLLYQLFLLYKDKDKAMSIKYGEWIKSKYPKTIYAKLVDNPFFKEEDFAANEQLKKSYKFIYDKLSNFEYRTVEKTVDSLLILYPNTDFSDNVLFLKVLASGKMEGRYKYQLELTNFLKKYPNSDIFEYAQSLLTVSENFQIQRYRSSKAKYSKELDNQHFIIMAYDLKKAEISDTLSSFLDAYLDVNSYDSLKIGSIILDEDNGILLLSKFQKKENASLFLTQFRQKVPKIPVPNSKNIKCFLITQANFDILYKSKDLATYQEFYQSHY